MDEANKVPPKPEPPRPAEDKREETRVVITGTLRIITEITLTE